MASIERLLIANRGEIACRIIDSAQKMGMHAIAVYSQADRFARHVRLADSAYFLGPARAQDSYLHIDRVLATAKESGAQAIHPGYGFLAENALFAKRVTEAGLIFIGPSPNTIEQMGSKAAAKALVIPAGVPVIPGYHGTDQSDEALLAHAKEIGFPLMIKAAAGGGGKGMRIVARLEDFLSSLHAARREAMGGFGDDRVILERFLENPRHIEAQIFGDQHGRVIHLYERDCSSQRRHQKVIEEAPAPMLSDALREDLLKAAVDAGKACNYIGAGTVEFLVDGPNNAFYFLEMNTRLQVEHPVTEMITGLDLVQWQLKVAMGEPLPNQSEIPSVCGHAFEARVYAEDPDQGFLPATGRLGAVQWPANDAGVRIDSGVDAGDVIGMDYDPMIAKVIVHDTDRDQALEKLHRALDGCFIDQPITNLSFLQALASSGRMQQASIDTSYLDQELSSILEMDSALAETALTLATLAWCHHLDEMAKSAQADGPWAISDGWRLGLPHQPRTISLENRKALHRMQVFPEGAGYRLECESFAVIAQAQFSLEQRMEHHAQRTVDAKIQPLDPAAGDETQTKATIHLTDRGLVEVCLGNRRARFVVQSEGMEHDSADASTGQVNAPMPGQVIEVAVHPGQLVQIGDGLVVMEAMKMELSIKALVDGVVSAVHVQSGDRVDANALLIEIAPKDLET